MARSAAADIALLRGTPLPPAPRTQRRRARLVWEDVQTLTDTPPNAVSPTPPPGSDFFEGVKAEITKLLDQFKAGKLDAAAVAEGVCAF